MVQGLLSTPDDDTKVRVRVPVACAGSETKSVAAEATHGKTKRIMNFSP
jgi:hypothetical protein